MFDSLATNIKVRMTTLLILVTISQLNQVWAEDSEANVKNSSILNSYGCQLSSNFGPTRDQTQYFGVETSLIPYYEQTESNFAALQTTTHTWRDQMFTCKGILSCLHSLTRQTEIDISSAPPSRCFYHLDLFVLKHKAEKVVIQFGSPVGQPELEERLGKFSGGKQACLLSERDAEFNLKTINSKYFMSN